MERIALHVRHPRRAVQRAILRSHSARSVTLRRALRPARDAIVRWQARRAWHAGVASEWDYWQDWIRTRGEPWPQDFERRLDPDGRVMEDRLVDLLTRVPTERVRILDVGAGPLTVLGKVLPGKRLEIHPIDALADDYDRLLGEAGIVPSVRTVRCTAEDVARRYAPETFDIAHARNCLDHAFDPLRAIEGMFAVVCNGGFVVLSHERNVGDATGYDGLHQWNFDVANDDLVVWRGEFVHRIGQRLGSAAELEVQPWKGDDGRHNIDCVIHKVGTGPRRGLGAGLRRESR